jgi:branched-chain amino acid transport system permease protein
MSDMWAAIPRRGRIFLAVLLALLLVAPSVLDRYFMSVLILIFYFAFVGQAWNIMMGYAGQLSLGHALYAGLGGYVAALLWFYFGIGPWIGVFAGVAVAAAFGAVIGWLGFRFGIQGVYFALLTIAFAEFTRIAFDNMAFTGGPAGLFLLYDEQRTGEWWNLRGGPMLFYYLGLILAVGGALLTAWLSRSRLGYQWLAVREDQEAALSLGVGAFRVKMIAVLISASMTAIGGVFLAFYYNSLFPSQAFDIGRSIEIILAPIIGGLGTIFGPIVGAFILTPLGEALISLTAKFGLDLPGTKAVFYGLTLMIIITLRPEGIWPWLKRILGLTENGK